MKIIRIIHGETMEIELTPEELFLAKEECEALNYKRFVADMVKDLDEEDDRAVLKALTGQELDDAIASMAFDIQHLAEDHGYSDDEAWEQVSDDYIARLTEMTIL